MPDNLVKRFLPRMSTLLLAFLLLALTWGLTGCQNGTGAGSNNNQSAADGKLQVVTTIFPQYDFVRQIAGDKVDLTMLLTPGTESHSYEPTPQDIIKIQNCDVFINVGGETDNWLAGVLDSLDTSSMHILSLLDCIAAVPEETVEGMESHEAGAASAAAGQTSDTAAAAPDGTAVNDASGSAAAEEVEYDEHVWTSPKQAMLIVSRITDTLCAADPANAEYYKTQSAAYLQQLSALDAELEQVCSTSRRQLIVVGDRYPFLYLSRDYGLQYYAAFPGCAAETEPSAATMAFLIDKVRENKIPVVFYIEFSNQKLADTICESTGAAKLELHSCHNLSKDDFAAGVTYLEVMQRNVANLKEALN